MNISKSLLGVIIIILFITLLAQNKVLHDKINEKQEYQFIQGGDIEKAKIIDSLQNIYDSLAAQQYGTIISEETE